MFLLETKIIKQSNSDGLGKVQTLLPCLIPGIATMGRFNRIEHQSWCKFQGCHLMDCYFLIWFHMDLQKIDFVSTL